MGHQSELITGALGVHLSICKGLWSVQEHSEPDITHRLSWKRLNRKGLDTPRIGHGIASAQENICISRTNRTGRNPNLPWSVKEAEVPISSEANLKLKEENECIEEIRSSFPSVYLVQVIAN